MTIDILRHLNKKQQESVVNYSGPTVILAGAGSGKTRVLVSKVIYLINSSDKDIPEKLEKVLAGKEYIVTNLKFEQEVRDMSEQEKIEFTKEFGLGLRALEELVKMSYKTLGLLSFFTAGEKEARAWTIEKGMLAPQAAGVIHTDFEKNFIATDVVSYDDFIANGGWNGSKLAGKARLEGKIYEVKDGDVMIIRHGGGK